jgi:hypothetical protein
MAAGRRVGVAGVGAIAHHDYGGYVYAKAMTTPSLTERIQSIQLAMAKGDPTPAEVRGFEMTLCGLLGRFAREAVIAEVEFKKVIAASRIGAKSMAEAKAIAETQPAYARLLEAKTDHECCHQMLMTCRSHSRSISEEMRLQR